MYLLYILAPTILKTQVETDSNHISVDPKLQFKNFLAFIVFNTRMKLYTEGRRGGGQKGKTR